MKHRFTIKDCQNMSDAQLLRFLVHERLSVLNPWAPLAVRLKATSERLADQIMRESGKLPSMLTPTD